MNKLRTVLFLFFLSREKDFCVRVVVSSVRSGEKGWGSVGGKKKCEVTHFHLPIRI